MVSSNIESEGEQRREVAAGARRCPSLLSLGSVSMFWSQHACADPRQQTAGLSSPLPWPRDRPGCWVTGRWRRRSPVREMPPPRPETQKPARAAAARWWESVSRCCAGPGSLDGVTRWLSLNDGLVSNCRPWWAQLASAARYSSEERQNLFADPDNLLLGPLSCDPDSPYVTPRPAPATKRACTHTRPRQWRSAQCTTQVCRYRRSTRIHLLEALITRWAWRIIQSSEK